jgi:FtsP/CotA-like multicopper oxidase with cupredoxin domain
MKRRDFIKLSAVAGGSLLASNWLLETEIANAASSEIASKDGILQLTLVADEKLIKYGNTTRWAMTYNGIFPAPTLRANPGDTLKITLVNKLNQATNLHTHGLHVSPTKNSDNPLVMVAPGETFNYKIKIPLTQKSGTFWYHPHHHELSAGQVASGLAGVLVVEDALDQKAIIKDSTERLIVLADPRIGKTSAVAATSAMDLMHGRSGPNTLANGILVPSFTAIGSTPERWRIVNSCVSQYQTISIPGAEIFQVSADSSRLSRLTRTNQVTLTPGQRTELLISAPKAGIYKVQNGQQELAKIEFNSATKSVTPQELLPLSKISKIDKRRTITIEGSGMGMMGGMKHEAAFTFDGKPFDPKRIDQSVKFNTTEEWTLINPSSMDHPFHLHAWPFQVANDGSGNFLDGWHDTVNLPSGKTVKIRIPFVDISGTTVYHCHILDHEDAGMMGIIKVS